MTDPALLTVATAPITGAPLSREQAEQIYSREVANALIRGEDRPPQDPATGLPDAKVWVRVFSRTHGMVVCGAYVPAGWSEHHCFESHAIEFTKLVEPASQAEREFAADQYRRDLEDAEAAKNRVEGRTYAKHYDPSYPAAFKSLYRRDILPFDSAVRIPASEVGKLPQAAPVTSSDPSFIPTAFVSRAVEIAPTAKKTRGAQ